MTRGQAILQKAIKSQVMKKEEEENNLMFLYQSFKLHIHIRVAKAVVYLLCLATLKSPAAGSKNCQAGGLKLGYFLSVSPTAVLSSSNLPISCRLCTQPDSLY